MIVVADTTRLLALARVGQLDIVRALYHKVLVPREVHRELVERRPDAEGVEALRMASCIAIVDAPAAERDHEGVLDSLDTGEAAALRLAFARSALVLRDERAGRRAAREMGLAVRGTLGMLVEARRSGIIVAVSPILADLERVGFRTSAELRVNALRAAGELP